ncbi:MAG TPA: (2Fe-2S)-binding protein [Steroidobacter sp.]|uniref:(2Fe-2S)-binding protein n=1 Tax=Steroidobacter sp. TaxID=1978227 RepID=UPI002ED9292D
MQLNVNGERREVDVDDDAPLMWVLREKLGLTSVKFGCGVGVCGACTVHIDGVAQRSCTTPLSAVAASSVVTLEGLPGSAGMQPGQLHPVQTAWIEQRVPQCGYCQPGMIMAVSALLKQTPQPTDAQVNEAITNLCRCGTYPRVRRAIQSLSRS